MAYTTEAKIESYLGESFDESSTPSTADITNMIAWEDAIIDKHTGTKFAATTVTDEILDGQGEQRFRLPKSPIISVTNFYEDTTGGLGATSTTWTERTEGRTNSDNFVILEDEGILHFHSNIPSAGVQNIKTTYVYGHSTVPAEVEYLSTLLVVRSIIKARAADSSYGNQSKVTVGPINVENKISDVKISIEQLDNEIEEAWQAIGKFRSISW